ncbi:MAG: ATP-dependent DNA helicase RecG [Gammaproteobacteria bacterium]
MSASAGSSTQQRNRSKPAESAGAIPAELTVLKGVGPALAERLQRLNVFRPEDLLFVLPQRYEDRTRIVAAGSLIPGQRAVVEVTVELAEVVFRRRRTLLVRVADGTGLLTLRFFYFSRAQQRSLARGSLLRCYGEVRSGPNGLEMVHPEYTLLKEDEPQPLEDRLTPIYPTTEGLQQFRLRKLVDQVLSRYLQNLHDFLPEELLQDMQLPSLADAIRYLHKPPPSAELMSLAEGRHPAQRRLALEEILAHHLSLLQIKQRSRKKSALPLPQHDKLRATFFAALGFELTGDQLAVLQEIETDLADTHPMMRLLQGDVGCGKTVVAAAAALCAAGADRQTVVMAPTELLAEQHLRNFVKWFEPLGVRVEWLSGSLTSKKRAHAYEAIASGVAQVIVGTHAVFQEAVDYHDLALVIVDEQHRFGVHQRLSLMEKGMDGGRRPHQLVMTATPIPRTLAMTMYADLDVSIIREMPPGRTPVNTVALPQDRRADVVSRVRKASRSGQRVYWVCPLIEESEVLEYQNAESTAEMLAEALPELRIGLVHGRMRPDAKDKIMKRFASGDCDLLVATTVIEVGVDVPEASLMIIENAERMGLSQLHQLRGRVGRGSAQSACVLLYKGPLSQVARHRIDVMRNTNDGFEVAQKDLELRGPGEVLGLRQTGALQMRIAELVRDADLIPLVQKIAKALGDNPAAVKGIMQRWIGQGRRYSEV